MAGLDTGWAHFNRAKVPWGPGAKEGKVAASSLMETYEKQLAYWLAAANITLADTLPAYGKRVKNVEVR